MIFEAKKDNLFSIIFYGSFAIMLGILMVILLNTSKQVHYLSVIVLVLTLLLLIWIWYGTQYKIDNYVLNIESGPFKKNVPIRTITKIELGKTMWVGYKLGLSKGGLIIHYNKYDEIYITPENQKKFCNALKRIHNNIVIEQNKN